jgi:hypothetical protein
VESSDIDDVYVHLYDDTAVVASRGTLKRVAYAVSGASFRERGLEVYVTMRLVHRAFWIFAACVGAVSLTAQSTSPRYTIAFKGFPPSNTDIFIAAGDGSNSRPLAPDPALDYNTAFSADGRWIVFTSHRAGSADLYRISRR